MSREKFKRCDCGGKIMTDELRRGFNAKNEDGKLICAECKVAEIYKKAGVKSA